MLEKLAAQPNSNRITRFLHVVEWLGNALPHPVTLFALFAASIVVFSGILGHFEVAVIDPRPEGAKGRADNGLIMAFVAKYQPKAGVGTLIAIMLPYSVTFLAFWSVFFFLWTFVLGLPVGPASPTYYSTVG